MSAVSSDEVVAPAGVRRTISLIRTVVRQGYALAILSVLGACVGTPLLRTVVPDRPLSLVMFFAAVALTTGLGGLGAGVLATLLSALACDYFFLAPLHSLAVSTSDLPLFILFILAAVMINGLSGRLRAQTRRADQRFFQLVQGLDGIVWEINPRTMQFTFVSRRAEILLGYPIRQWLTEPEFRSTIMHPADRDRVKQLWDTAVATGGEHTGDYRLLTADGQELWIRETIIVAHDAGGRPMRITGLGIDITSRKAEADELADGRARLFQMARQLVSVQEAERRSIARELHDEIGQVLTGLKLTLEMSARLPVAGAQLEMALTLIQDLMKQVEGLSLDLRPAMLDDLGLLPALHWHCKRYTAATGVQVQLEHTNAGCRFPTEIEIAAYRIIQEALTNVARHANVDQVVVRLWATDTILGIQVADAGRGFESEEALVEPTTRGLLGMNERSTLLGGHLAIETAPGMGTSITVDLPLYPDASWKTLDDELGQAAPREPGASCPAEGE